MNEGPDKNGPDRRGLPVSGGHLAGHWLRFGKNFQINNGEWELRPQTGRRTDHAHQLRVQGVAGPVTTATGSLRESVPTGHVHDAVHHFGDIDPLQLDAMPLPEIDDEVVKFTGPACVAAEVVAKLDRPVGCLAASSRWSQRTSST